MNRSIVIAAGALVLAITTYAQGQRFSAVPGKLIVQHRLSADRSAAYNSLRANGASVEKEITQGRLSVIRVPESSIDKVRQALNKSGLFNFVERDFYAHGSLLPNDPGYGSQWHLPKVQAPAAWDLNTGTASVPVAFLDSGVDPAHPDLAARLVPGWSFLTGTSNTADVHGHGTATAGLQAITDNSNGISGVTWKNPIMPLVVLDATDYASYSNIASAIMYAADHGVRIISISIAGSSPSSALQSAVDYAWNKGAIVIAAAGNSATSIPYYPAACDKVIAVSATDGNDALASFSNYGTWIDIAAPGTMIYTTTNGGGYGYWQGTSFSAPIVSSVASLILSIRPTITNSVLVNTLLNSADDIGTAGYDSSFGWGRVNAYKAAVAANGIAGADATPPSVTISNPPSGSILSGGVSIQGTASDNIGVSKIELYVDGLLSGTVTASPYSFFWNSGAVPNGSHSLMVKAYDAAGNNASASVSISTSNVLVHTAAPPPTVTITSPTSGSKVVGKTTVGVSASSSIGVAQVSIYVDNVLMYTAAAGPYSYDWNAGKAGKSSHVITATAWDLNGSMSSTSVTVK